MWLMANNLGLYRGTREIVRDFSWRAQAGERWAIVGANGLGKSTLLRAFAQQLDAGVRVDGTLQRAPGMWSAFQGQSDETDERLGGVTLAALADRACAPLRAMGAELLTRQANLTANATAETLATVGEMQALFEARGGYALDTRLEAWLARFGVDGRQLAARASGGERQRARLAGALASGAELLLLDEPTNHLDLPTRALLAQMLSRHRGMVIFTSHDRAFIDQTATHTLWWDARGLHAHMGGYEAASQTESHAQRERDKRAKQRAQRTRELEAMVAELRTQPHRTAHTRRQRAERMLAALRSQPASTPTTATVAPVQASPATARASAGWLLRAEHLTFANVVVDASWSMDAGARMALVGANGSGKSTLLALLAGATPSEDPRAKQTWRAGARVFYAGQRDRGVADDTTPHAALAAWVGDARAWGLLHEVGIAREVGARLVSTLSGGERARVSLALLMACEADVLLLDEPTNDLDLPSIERLQTFLQGTTAAWVVASHDARLLEVLRPDVFSLQAGELVAWRGGLPGYRQQRRRLESDAEASMEAASGDAPAAEAKAADDFEATLDAWTELHATAEAVLADPLRWGERERARWWTRRREAEEALWGAWQDPAPPPLPPYRVREAGWVVWGERVEGGLRVWLDGGDASQRLLVMVHEAARGPVAHLVLAPVTEGCCRVRSAALALVRGGARLAFYRLGVRVVQWAGDWAPEGFEPWQPGWWVWRRGAFERAEGWRA